MIFDPVSGIVVDSVCLIPWAFPRGELGEDAHRRPRSPSETPLLRRSWVGQSGEFPDLELKPVASALRRSRSGPFGLRNRGNLVSSGSFVKSPPWHVVYGLDQMCVYCQGEIWETPGEILVDLVLTFA